MFWRVRPDCVTVGVSFVILATAGPGTGCGSHDSRFQSIDPLQRAEAAVRAADAGQPDAVHELVSLLDDNDSAVRFYAIQSLRRLCGQDFGYRYFAPEAERAAAVRRWREALRIGDVVVGGRGGSSRDTAADTADRAARLGLQSGSRVGGGEAVTSEAAVSDASGSTR
jgi:hypothetical protein